MVDEFCNSHFSFEEKRELFFPDHDVICRTCHKPRIKRLINLQDFSIRHQNLICMFGRPHGGVPPAVAPHGGAPCPTLHGAHGPHINPLYVRRVEFNVFRALVNQNMQQLQNQQNQLKGNLLQLQNQLQGNMQQLQNQLQGQINQMGQNIANTLGNINNNIARINQRLGIH